VECICGKAVVLLSPEDGTDNVDVRTEFTWLRPSGNVAGYRLYVGQEANPASDEDNLVEIFNDAETLSFTLESDLLPVTDYFWQVVAFGAFGDSEASESWRFTTQIVPPGQVTLTAPVNYAEEVALEQTLTWTTPTGIVTGYKVFIGTPELPETPTAIVTETTFSPTLSFATTYRWKVIAFNNAGDGEASETRSFTTIEEHTSVDEATTAPIVTELLTNFPNPFNPETTIRFALSNESNLEIIIYNVRGQLIRTLVNGNMSSGVHNVVWNGRDDNGDPVGSGMYFYRMRAGDYQSVGRMMLLK